MAPTFDLTTRPWLPVVARDGRMTEVGIEEALVRAHELAELRDQSPLTTAALLRLLLAVLHASLDGPGDLPAWRRLWKAGRWNAKAVRTYLDTWRSRFDLFDAKHPFFQVAGFTITGKDPAPVSKLALELASGNTTTLFDHTVEERAPAWTPAMAARALVTAQAYALGGGVGATSEPFGKHPNLTHATQVGGVAVYLQGDTLFETLALNLLVVDRRSPVPGTASDRPTWEEKKVAPPGPQVPAGYLQYLTWRSRMVRLIAEGDGEALRVTSMFYSQGWALSRDLRNPAWAFTKHEKLGLLPVALREGRALWRDSSALLAAIPSGREGEQQRPAALVQAARLLEQGTLSRAQSVRCLAVGLANDKAKPLFWAREDWPVPARVVEDPELAALLGAALVTAEEASKAVYAGCSRFCEGLKDGFLEVRDHAMAEYWAALDPAARTLLAGLGAGDEGALSAWTDAVVSAARRAYLLNTDNVQRRSGRELQARVRGEAMLEWKLRPLWAPTEEEAAHGV